MLAADGECFASHTKVRAPLQACTDSPVASAQEILTALIGCTSITVYIFFNAGDNRRCVFAQSSMGRLVSLFWSSLLLEDTHFSL